MCRRSRRSSRSRRPGTGDCEADSTGISKVALDGQVLPRPRDPVRCLRELARSCEFHQYESSSEYRRRHTRATPIFEIASDELLRHPNKRNRQDLRICASDLVAERSSRRSPCPLAERTSAASQRKDRRSSIGRWYRRTRRRTSTVRPRTRRLTPGPIVSAQLAKGATNRRMPFTMHRACDHDCRDIDRCSSTFLDFAIHRYRRIDQHHGPIDRESCL